MNLEFFIKLREMVSSGLVKMASTAQKTAASMRGVNGTLAQSYDQIKEKISQLESAIGKSTSLKHIREARRELEQLQRMANRAPGNTTGGGGGFFAGLMRQALPALGIAGAMALGGNALNSGLTAQARTTSFEVMSGKEEGGKLNKDLTKFAQDSIFGNEVYQNAQTMLAFGAAAKEVMPDLKMIGDISLGDKDKLGRLTLAFSQVRAAGKLTGQDLLQFVNAGFNPLQVIAEKTGLSLGVLREKMSDGQISFQMVKEAFQSATSSGGRFFDMTNKIAKTDFGKWEAFKGQLDGLSMQIGGVLAPAFGWLITTALVPIVNLLSQSVDWMKQNSEWLQPLALSIGVATAAYALYVSVMNAGGIATTLMSGAMKVLNFVMSLNPVGLVIAGISALIALVIYAWNHFEKFRGVVMGTWEAMKGFGTMLKDYVIDKFRAILALAGSLGTALGKLFQGDFGGAWDTAKSALSVYNQSSLDAKAKAKDTLVGTAKNVVNAYQLEINKKNSAKEPDAAIPSATKLTSSFNTLAGEDDEKTARGIAGGGPRVININGVKFADKIEINAKSVGEGLENIEERLQEMFLRLLNSGAAVQ
jgi:tape measure domain-containing protein